jgi:hypothetical protein
MSVRRILNTFRVDSQNGELHDAENADTANRLRNQTIPEERQSRNVALRETTPRPRIHPPQDPDDEIAGYEKRNRRKHRCPDTLSNRRRLPQ